MFDADYPSGMTVNETSRVRIGTATGKNIVALVLPVLELSLRGTFSVSGFQVPVCSAPFLSEDPPVVISKPLLAHLVCLQWSLCEIC
jgi:hypothetical protein